MSSSRFSVAKGFPDFDVPSPGNTLCCSGSNVGTVLVGGADASDASGVCLLVLFALFRFADAADAPPAALLAGSDGRALSDVLYHGVSALSAGGEVEEPDAWWGVAGSWAFECTPVHQ